MQRVLITGASRGIGRAIAEILATPQTLLLLHGRDQQALEETAAACKQAGAKAELLICDLSKPALVERMIDQISTSPLDVFVNNAGVGMVNPLEQMTREEWDLTVAVNITAPFLLYRGLVPTMPSGSSVVNILSGAAKSGIPGWSSYCMSKFAMDGFAKAVREELRAKGVRVINIYPNATDTDIWEQVPGDWPREKMMRPESVATAVKAALDQPPNIVVEDISLGIIQGRL
ncbi:MAG: SDR family NAD(P)-dependent oxidoreductase [candidate division Zixibacteria bacterium]|nr:SDR family NAD(P)-dependent oxidoreductase [candidate division Zixibacteria bacterium]